MVTKFDKYNESVRNLMTPKSEKEVLKSLKGLSAYDIMKKGIQLNLEYMVRKGIEKGASSTMQFLHNEAVMIAIRNNNLEIMKLLLDNGYKPSEYIVEWTIRYGTIDMMQLLIDNGVIVTDRMIRNAVNYNKTYSMIHFLKKHVTNESVRDQMTPKTKEDILKHFDKFHPLDKVIKGVNMGIFWLVKDGVDELLKQGGEVGDILHNNLSNYYIPRALEKGNIDIIKYLIEVGGYKLKKNDIQWTVTNATLEMIKLLLSYGYEADNKDIEYVRQYRAEEDDQEEIIKLLNKHNKDRFINKIKKLV